jgi:5-methylcytosine-specific restriction protein A
MTERAEFSPKTKLLAFRRAGGCCEKCGNKIVGSRGPVQYDHIIPAAIGGSNELDNCQVLCKRPCHDLKTHKTDVPEIARSARLEKKAAGIKKRKGKPMPGTTASGWKHKMDRSWERR